MKTNSEKQVAAFDQVLGHCNALGPVYNPSKASMKVAALTALLTSAQQSIQAVDTAKSTLINAVNARQQVFRPLPGLLTRILNALGGTDASPELIADIRLYRDKFYPSHKAKQAKSTPEGGSQAQPIPADSSRGPLSQLDFESRLRNFGTIIDLLKGEPSYKPNETELAIAGLTARLTMLRDKHKAVNNAKLALSNARLSCKRAVFQEEGIYGTAKSVKQYLLSVLGTTSEKYRQVSKIKFQKRK